MPVTTKAQRSAEGEDSGNCVKPRMCEFLSKIKKSAKSRDNLNSLLFLPAEPNRTKVAGSSSGGLFSLPRSISNGKNIKGLAERSCQSSILPRRVRTHEIHEPSHCTNELRGGIPFIRFFLLLSDFPRRPTRVLQRGRLHRCGNGSV